MNVKEIAENFARCSESRVTTLARAYLSLRVASEALAEAVKETAEYIGIESPDGKALLTEALTTYRKSREGE